jgi:hypothetical protein
MISCTTMLPTLVKEATHTSTDEQTSHNLQVVVARVPRARRSAAARDSRDVRARLREAVDALCEDLFAHRPAIDSTPAVAARLRFAAPADFQHRCSGLSFMMAEPSSYSKGARHEIDASVARADPLRRGVVDRPVGTDISSPRVNAPG